MMNMKMMNILGIIFLLITTASAQQAKKALFLGNVYIAESSKAGDVDISDDKTSYIMLPLSSDWKMKDIYQEKVELNKEIIEEKEQGKITQSEEDKKRVYVKQLPNEIAIPSAETNKSIKYLSQYLMAPDVLISKDSKSNEKTVAKVFNILKIPNMNSDHIELIKKVETNKQNVNLKFNIFKTRDDLKKKHYVVALPDPISLVQSHNESQSSDSSYSPAVVIGVADSEVTQELLFDYLQKQIENIKVIDSDRLSFNTERDWKEFSLNMICEDLVSRVDFENCNVAQNKYAKNQISSTTQSYKLRPESKKILSELNLAYAQFIKAEKQRIKWDNIDTSISDSIVEERISDVKQAHQRYLSELIQKKLLLTVSSDEALASNEKLKLAIMNKQADINEALKNVELEGDVEKSSAAKKKNEVQLKALSESQNAWSKYYSIFIKFGKSVYSEPKKNSQIDSAMKTALIKLRMNQLNSN